MNRLTREKILILQDTIDKLSPTLLTRKELAKATNLDYNTVYNTISRYPMYFIERPGQVFKNGKLLTTAENNSTADLDDIFDKLSEMSDRLINIDNRLINIDNRLSGINGNLDELRNL